MLSATVVFAAFTGDPAKQQKVRKRTLDFGASVSTESK